MEGMDYTARDDRTESQTHTVFADLHELRDRVSPAFAHRAYPRNILIMYTENSTATRTVDPSGHKIATLNSECCTVVYGPV